MALFAARQSDPEPVDRKIVAPTDERTAVYLQSVLILLECIRRFPLDLRDIDTEGFRKQVDELTQAFAPVTTPSSIGKQITGGEASILDYIDREHEYLRARDSEFRSVIEMLRSMLAALTQDNADFQVTIEASGNRLDELCGIDDIRRLRAAVRAEASDIRTVVDQKRTRDADQLDDLRAQLNATRLDLDATRNEALTDPLTGALNRRALDDYMYKCWSAGARLSVLMIDVDHFKSINDTCGHDVGEC